MPKVNVEIPDDLHAQAKALGHLFSISRLTRLGLEWAVQHYGAKFEPGALGAATGNLQAVRPAPPPPQTPTQPAKAKSLDPVGDALKPWVDGRRHEWYDLAGVLSYLGLDRPTLESVLDPVEDLDRANDDREVLDAAAINRVLSTLPANKFPSSDRYHTLSAWLEARA